MAHRDLYAAYHNHKEQIAYAASVLYLAGAAVLMFMDLKSVAPERGLTLTFSAVIFAAAFGFVAWQLRQRQLAADVVEACERLLARIAGGETSTGPTDAHTYYGLHLPHFLVDELVIVAESRKPLRGATVPELITYLTMLAATLLVAIRITGESEMLPNPPVVLQGLVEKEGIPFESITRELVVERFLKKPVTPADVLAARGRVMKQLKRLEDNFSGRSLTARRRGTRAKPARAPHRGS